MKLVRHIKLILLLFISVTYVNGQDSFIRHNHSLIDKSNLTVVSSEIIVLKPVFIDINKEIPFLNAVVKISEQSELDILNSIWWRTSVDGNNWSGYSQVMKDIHADDEFELTISDLMYYDMATKYVQLKIINNSNSDFVINDLEILFSAPIEGHGNEYKSESTYRSGCEMPLYQKRKDWCSSNECPIGSGAETEVTHLIVHHSAGSSTNSNWPAVVRSIWHYHVDTRGWDDIGYNWLIDAKGVLYEGRPDNIRGAHMCGKNSGTMGICFLGNFEDFDPTDKSLLTLDSLLAWKCDQKNLNPLNRSVHNSSGKNMYIISGHKDGCNPGYTLCPGAKFYPLLPSVRVNVETLLSACMTSTSILELNKLPKLIKQLVSDQLMFSNVNLNTDYTIYNTFGQMVKKGLFDINGVIDISNVKNGNYFVQLKSLNFQSTYRFIILEQ